MKPKKILGVVIGAHLGLIVTYLFGAFVAGDFNALEWSTFWRLWCAVWAMPWVAIGALLALETRW